MMRSPLLQSCNKYLPFSFSPVTPFFPITPFHISVSVPICALKSPLRTVDSIPDTRRRASFTSSTKAWYSLVALRAYTCNRHLAQSPIQYLALQHADLWSQKNPVWQPGLLRIPTLTWADILGSAPELKSFHPPSRSTLPEASILVEETPTISRW